jgi:hypothetical protein
MYKLAKMPLSDEPIGVFKGTNMFIPMNPDNTDYQEYLKWLAEGNTPLPADE